MSLRRNDIFVLLLLAILALAPIPLGSNRPVFWLCWAAILGLIGLFYGLTLLRQPPPLSLAAYRPEASLLAVLLIWIAVQAAAISLDPGSTILSLISFATYGILFLLVAETAANPDRASRMVLALFAIIAAFAFYGLINLTQFGDTLLGAEKQAYRGFATATFVNRNSFATFLAAGLATGAAILAHKPRGALLIATMLGLAFILAALLATGSRMGLIAGLAGALAALFSSPSRRLLLLTLPVAAIVILLYGAGSFDRLLLEDDGNRLELYRQVWSAILARPLTGYGAGSFAAVFPALQHAPLPQNLIWDHAHSSYLSLWFECGLLFGSLPLAIVALLILRAVRARNDPARTLPASVTIGVSVVFSLHSLVDFSAEIMANALLFSAVLALPGAGASDVR